MDDIANTALVHREECVPVFDHDGGCEAEIWCTERVRFMFGIGGGYSYLCARHYHRLPEADDGTGSCGCLVCTDQA